MSKVKADSIIKQVGESYYTNDVSHLLSFVKEDCVFESNIPRMHFQGKQSLEVYYTSLFLSTPIRSYHYRIIVLEKDSFSYPKGTVGLFLKNKHRAESGQLLFLHTDEQGLITRLYVDDAKDYLYTPAFIDWGIGIPQYSPNDIMNEEEIFTYCFLDVYAFYKKIKCNILYFHLDLKAIPSLIIQSKIEKTALLIQADAKKLEEKDWLMVPQFSRSTLNTLLYQARMNKAKARVARMHVESKDDQRREQGLALVGDDFNIRGSLPMLVKKVDGQIRIYVI